MYKVKLIFLIDLNLTKIQHSPRDKHKNAYTEHKLSFYSLTWVWLKFNIESKTNPGFPEWGFQNEMQEVREKRISSTHPSTSVNTSSTWVSTSTITMDLSIVILSAEAYVRLQAIRYHDSEHLAV